MRLFVTCDLVQTVRFAAWLFCGWLAAAAGLTPEAVAAGLALPPLAEVQRQVAETHDQVTSVEVTYEVVPVRWASTSSHSRHTVAQKGRLRFAENVHFSERADP